MGKKLDIIISELKKMNTRIERLESQTDENTQLLKVVINRQDATDAKLDNMALDINKLIGEVAVIKENTVTNAEMSLTLQDVIAQVDDVKTDIKVMKKAIAH